MRYGVIAIMALTLLSPAAFADPAKDESGHGKWRGSPSWQDDGPRYGRSYGRAERIPRGHLPPPG